MISKKRALSYFAALVVLVGTPYLALTSGAHSDSHNTEHKDDSASLPQGSTLKSESKSGAKSSTKTSAATTHDAHAAAPSGPDADEALVRLLEGNLRYVSGHTNHLGQDEGRRMEVAQGQHPFAVILSCADSRVPPEILFDQGLGDLFVVRVAGNIATDECIGSIEYAVEHLGANLIVVMGHERCGAVKAALDGGHAPGRIGTLVEAIEPAVSRSRGRAGDPLDNAVRQNVKMNVDRLTFAEPILSERVRMGSVEVVGARYDLDGGTVEIVR